MALTKATYSMIAGAAANVLDYGAVGDGITNDSAAIIAAIAASDNVVIPSGTFIVDSMIELGVDKCLYLSPGTTLQRSVSGTTDPVIWLKGNSAGLFGAGSASKILTANRCPNGVVRLGHADMTASHANVNWCTIKDVWIAGSTQFGQTTGNNDVSLMLCNPQFSGFTSYFNTIDNVFLANANYGLWLRGWANANKISNVFFQRIGNTSLGNNLLYMNGGLDNVISNVFCHGSTNSQMLVFEDLDNTSGGGFLHVPSFNSVTNFCAEPGGASAVYLVTSATTATDNIISGNSNVVNFGTQTTTFRAQNTIVTNILTKFRNIKRQGTGTALTLSAGNITIIDLYHLINPESSTSDDLDNILNGQAGDVVILGPNGGNTITVRDNSVSSGNITLDNDAAFVMNGGDRISLIYDGSFWRELSRSNNTP
jgi:hypothetical protein